MFSQTLVSLSSTKFRFVQMFSQSKNEVVAALHHPHTTLAHTPHTHFSAQTRMHTLIKKILSDSFNWWYKNSLVRTTGQRCNRVSNLVLYFTQRTSSLNTHHALTHSLWQHQTCPMSHPFTISLLLNSRPCWIHILLKYDSRILALLCSSAAAQNCSSSPYYHCYSYSWYYLLSLILLVILRLCKQSFPSSCATKEPGKYRWMRSAPAAWLWPYDWDLLLLCT